MSKTKSPLIIANWKDSLKDVNDVKNKLKDIEKEYIIYKKKKAKELKRKYVKKELSFKMAAPSPLIYQTGEYLRSKKEYKNISVGAQNFDEIEKVNKNNIITLSHIKSAGAKFVILNNEENKIEKNIEEDQRATLDEKVSIKDNKKITANEMLLSRLNSVSKKIDTNSAEIVKKNNNFDKKILQKIEDKISASLQNKFNTILVVRNEGGDLNTITEFIKNIIKNIHYNLFNNLTICYETEKGINLIDRVEIEDCQEKCIAIRRTISNMFGIDNAKKIKIIYSGRIEESNVREILENGGVDGIMLTGESLTPKTFGKILAEINI